MIINGELFWDVRDDYVYGGKVKICAGFVGNWRVFSILIDDDGFRCTSDTVPITNLLDHRVFTSIEEAKEECDAVFHSWLDESRLALVVL